MVTRYLRPGCCRGNDRISQVPGEPRISVCTCSVDSGRTACTRPLRCCSVALGISKAKAPTKGLSKLNSMAFGLAVYASQDGLPRHHARLASGRWSGATGRAFHPQGSYERFQSCILTSHPPFPSFAWHNEIDRRAQTVPSLILRSPPPTRRNQCRPRALSPPKDAPLESEKGVSQKTSVLRRKRRNPFEQVSCVQRASNCGPAVRNPANPSWTVSVPAGQGG